MQGHVLGCFCSATVQASHVLPPRKIQYPGFYAADHRSRAVDVELGLKAVCAAEQDPNGKPGCDFMGVNHYAR